MSARTINGQVDQAVHLTEQGEAGSSDELFTHLYNELHRLAQRELRRNAQLTISPTTLLHETYVNLSGRQACIFPNRASFLVYASRAMRGLLIDYIRRRQADKRGGRFVITTLPTEGPAASPPDDNLEGISEALDALAAVEPRLAQIVDFRFFCGFSFAEIASVLDISERTAQRDWNKARILLRRHLRQHEPELSGTTPDGSVCS
jgi:RNA polymerase sigma factor (TIGR02999 family)